MAKTAISVQKISETAAAKTYSDADDSNGNKIANPNGDVFLHLKNPGENSATVTIAAQGTSHDVPGYGPMTKADLSISLAASEEKFVGPFSKSAWNDSSGDINVTYSGTGASDVDVAALALTKY
jgi:hypothetical protein